MKKIYFAVWLMSLLFAQSKAQAQTEVNATPAGEESKWFVRIHGSYGLPTPGSYRAYSSSTAYNDTTRLVTRNKTNRNGLGKGLRAGLGVGYIVNDLINLGLDADMYWSGDITSGIASSSVVNTTGSSTVKTDYNEVTLNATMITLTPNITLKAISKSNFYLYTRLGVSVGLSTKVKETNASEEFTKISITAPQASTLIVNNSTQKEYEYKGGLPIGYFAALGVQTKLTEKLRLFAELQVVNVTYAPQKKVLTQYVANGTDRLKDPSTTLKQRETEFVSEFTVDNKVDSNNSQNANSPQKANTLKMPFSSINLSVGLAFRF